MRARDRIQQEVNTILAFTAETQWMEFLKKKGNAHKYYYHYTTLGTLKVILDTCSWKFKRADYSNDPLELPIHNASFTTSVLNSMGMWGMYSKLFSQDDIGVRIGIPRQIFKELFSKNATWYSRDSGGVFHKFCKSTPTITDIAYWHFGQSNKTSLAIYRNYQIPGAALHFCFEEDKQLPPCFKNAIWRQEEEVRVYCDFSQKIDIPEELYLKVKPEHFQKMDFYLSPAISNYKSFSLFPHKETLEEVLDFVAKEILKDKLDVKCFILPTKYEQWNNKGTKGAK